MSLENSSTRRHFLAATATAGAVGLASSVSADSGAAAIEQASGGGGASGKTAIRPFRYQAPEAALADLLRRVAATRWPPRETVANDSRAYNSRPLRRSPVTGRLSTTGASARRG